MGCIFINPCVNLHYISSMPVTSAEMFANLFGAGLFDDKCYYSGPGRYNSRHQYGV
jgi:hypothetical protein